MSTALQPVLYVRQLVEEQRAAANEPTIPGRVAGCIITAARLQKQLRALSNKHFSIVLQEVIWAEIDMLSPESAIIGEAIHRLSTRK